MNPMKDVISIMTLMHILAMIVSLSTEMFKDYILKTRDKDTDCCRRS